MTAPEVGKRYRCEFTCEVVSVEASEPLASRAVIVRLDGFNGRPTVRHFVFGEDAITWTEVEPEYVVGALYEDAEGRVWRFTDQGTNPWVLAGGPLNWSRACKIDEPTRLYRGDEQ